MTENEGTIWQEQFEKSPELLKKNVQKFFLQFTGAAVSSIRNTGDMSLVNCNTKVILKDLIKSGLDETIMNGKPEKFLADGTINTLEEIIVKPYRFWNQQERLIMDHLENIKASETIKIKLIGKLIMKHFSDTNGGAKKTRRGNHSKDIIPMPKGH